MAKEKLDIPVVEKPELVALRELKASIRAKIAAGPEPPVPEPTPDDIEAERVRREKERAFEIQRLTAANAACVHVKPNGQQVRPDGLLPFVCINGWPVDKALAAFKHFSEHGWYAVPGNQWGEVPA